MAKNNSHGTYKIESRQIALRRVLDLLKPLQNKWNFPELNGIRLIAIIAIILGHIYFNVYYRVVYRIIAPINKVPDNFMHIVDTAMDVLLVLSGFLIGTILFRSIDRKQAGYFIHFYLRRAMRLFPGYYVLLFFLSFYLRGGVDFSNKYFWQELFFFTNYPHPGAAQPYLMSWSWYLSVEEHFYVGMPIAVWLFARFFQRASVWPYLLLVTGAYIITILVLFSFVGEWDPKNYNMYIFQPTHSRLIFLLSGVLAAYLSHYEAKRVVVFFQRNPGVTLLGSLLPFILIGLWFVLAITIGTENPDACFIITLVLWPLSALTWSVYYLMCVHVDFIGKKWLRAPVFKYLAPISYPIYLTHPAIIKFLVCPYAAQSELFIKHGAVYAWSVCTVMTIVVCLAVSYAMHILVEKPVVWLREHISVAKSYDQVTVR